MNEMTERLLELLRASRTHISAEEIARRLGIPFDQVTVHADVLRHGGIRIDFTPESGYGLGRTPDLLFGPVIHRYLEPGTLGRHIIFRHEVSSTNTLAMSLARSGEPHGTVVVADRQTGGRGRMGRIWESPAGVNIYMSVILHPPVLPARASQIPIVSVIALSRAMERFEPALKYGIKWPNDLLVGERKLAGILCEMKTDGEEVHHLVTGIGVNVNMTGMDDSISATATSIAIETGGTYFRPVLAAYIIEELESAYDSWLAATGLEPFMADWEERSLLRGLEVSISTPGGELTGVAEGLAPSGALRLRTGDGLEEIFSGDSSIRRIDW